MSESEESHLFFNDLVLGKTIKIELKDNRCIYGILHCVDKFKNMVLVEAVEEIETKYISPINKSLSFFMRNTISADKYITFPEEIKSNSELMKEINEKFCENKFWVGQVIIPGDKIKSISLQNIN